MNSWSVRGVPCFRKIPVARSEILGTQSDCLVTHVDPAGGVDIVRMNRWLQRWMDG